MKVSQGNVATYLSCGEVFNHQLIANLLLNPMVKGFRKPVKFGEIIGKNSILFFDSWGG